MVYKKEDYTVYAGARKEKQYLQTYTVINRNHSKKSDVQRQYGPNI